MKNEEGGKPQAPNPKPKTQDSKPQTPNPKTLRKFSLFFPYLCALKICGLKFGENWFHRYQKTKIFNIKYSWQT
jgi:hypothetical protein